MDRENCRDGTCIAGWSHWEALGPKRRRACFSLCGMGTACDEFVRVCRSRRYSPGECVHDVSWSYVSKPAKLQADWRAIGGALVFDLLFSSRLFGRTLFFKHAFSNTACLHKGLSCLDLVNSCNMLSDRSCCSVSDESCWSSIDLKQTPKDALVSTGDHAAMRHL